MCVRGRAFLRKNQVQQFVKFVIPSTSRTHVHVILRPNVKGLIRNLAIEEYLSEFRLIS